MAERTRDRLRGSVQSKFLVSYVLLIVLLLTLLNTYPVIVSRDLVFSAKESALANRAWVISSTLSTLEALTVDGVLQVTELLDSADLARIIITDNQGVILYDTSDSGNVGRTALLSEIVLAADGKDIFSSSYGNSVFLSKMSTPVLYRGEIIGVVYLVEYDTVQAELILGIQSNLQRISLVVIVVAVLGSLLFTRTLTHRIKETLQAIITVREGEYGYRVSVRGNDEIAQMGLEFNSLTDRLQSTEEVRRRFVSDASHELKTPLASIRLLTDSIVQNDEMINLETARDFVKDIGNEVDRLIRTTEKLLSLTRIDGEVRANKEPVDIKAVAARVAHMLKPLAGENRVALEMELAECLYVWATEDDMYQVIFNLVENGIKYNVPGGTVKIKLSLIASEVCLAVTDTGIGIPAEDLPFVFDRFYRVDKARSREAGGSGLGLSIVQDTVKIHRGLVEVFPLEEQGTSFIVRFPLFRCGRETGDDEAKH